MTENDCILLVISMGAATYIPRWAPLFFLTSKSLPDWLKAWLDLLPVAILSALLLPALVTTGEPRQLSFFQPNLLVGIPTFIVALKTKSLGGTVIVGMLLYWLGGKIL